MTNGVRFTGKTPDDLDLLATVFKDNLVGAINENVAKIATAEKMVKAVIGLAGPVVIPAVNNGAKVTGYQVSVTVAYPAGATITIGDSTGATSIVLAAGTATAIGDYSGFIYKPVSGPITINIAGGTGATGAATVMLRYTDI
jgi:hypothetical protein